MGESLGRAVESNLGDQDISMAVIGVGTVGCTIANRISYALNSYERLDFLYAHSSASFLDDLEVEHDSRLLVSGHVHFVRDKLTNQINGKDVVFIVTGLGGETGSKVAPYVARVVKQNNILCVGLLSFPFKFEGRKKTNAAQISYKDLSAYTDSLMCIENDKFFASEGLGQVIAKPEDLFSSSDQHFEAVVKGVVSLLLRPGMINIDFTDLKVVIANMGVSVVGFSSIKGDVQSDDLLRELLNAPLLKGSNLAEARGCLVCLRGGFDLTLHTLSEVGAAVEGFVTESATVVVGTVIEPDMDQEYEIIVVLTGLPGLEFEDSEGGSDYDVVHLSKTIEFEPHQASAGLSILSYFNDFLHQRYKGTKAKVRIEQSGNVVRLIVESPSGEVESIEKSLSDFGQVVVGGKKANDVLESRLDAERLEMKLEMAAMELKHSEKLLVLYQSENSDLKSRLGGLEDQVAEMQKVISTSLSFTQRELSRELKKHRGLPESLLFLIQGALENGLDDKSKELIETEVGRLRNDEEALSGLRRLVENTVYGVSGNAVFSFIVSVLNSLPK